MSAAPLRLDGELTIYRAAELKDVLLAAVAANDTLEIDLSGVEEFDTAGVQLLLLAKREAGARGGSLRLSGHSAPVLDAFQRLDLAAHFGDPLVLPA